MSRTAPLALTEVDPFELPEWLGEVRVTWAPEEGLGNGHLVRGVLTGPDDVQGARLACDLLAVDEAYPIAVTPSDVRVRAHQLWKYGQVLLGSVEERLTLAAPGTSFTADRTLECLHRLSLAVGARTDRFSALLSIGSRSSTHQS